MGVSVLLEHPIYLLYIYLALINIVLFVVMGADKGLARAGARRVPEATLFLLALIGGAAGGTLGMLAFRHKTKHAKFVAGFPLIFLLHIVILALLLTR